MGRRVVITGMGICSPLGNAVAEFSTNLYDGKSGIKFWEELKRLNFSCQIGGKPDLSTIALTDYFAKNQLNGLQSTGIVYGMIAATQAANQAQLQPTDKANWELGVQFGTGISGVDKFREAIYKIDEGNVRRLGSTSVYQTMTSGVSALIAGKYGAANRVATNSSACSSGVEALLLGFEHIQQGKATQMLVGSTSDSGPYIWGGFDALRVLPRKYNDTPEEASRPMSASASGFVPSSGAAAFVLEDMEAAQKRGATILVELVGGHLNSGGMRGGGSMTAANPEGIQRCIQTAIKNAQIEANQISSINGHLTATTKDSFEIAQWKEALGLAATDFPPINSFKGHFGHALAASGAIECVGVVQQLVSQQLFRNRNIEEVHPEIANLIPENKVKFPSSAYPQNYIAKASFGFGDVNACIIFKKYQNT